MGGDSYSKVYGFNSQHRILDGHFFTYICCKNCNDVCLKRPKINDKRSGVCPFKKRKFVTNNFLKKLPFLVPLQGLLLTPIRSFNHWEPFYAKLKRPLKRVSEWPFKIIRQTTFIQNQNRTSISYWYSSQSSTMYIS